MQRIAPQNGVEREEKDYAGQREIKEHRFSDPPMNVAEIGNRSQMKDIGSSIMFGKEYDFNAGQRDKRNHRAACQRIEKKLLIAERVRQPTSKETEKRKHQEVSKRWVESHF